MNPHYGIVIASDDKHEKVVAEIYFDDLFIALLSQEEGLDKLVLELPGVGMNEALILRRIPMTEFQHMLILAAKELALKR